ncbi:stress responsive A/B barrel domain-containing protein [Hypoxylon fragiforme]|uniref:stress responsive A/B barrel domain-containing protein n=1 Tax=Hypoxylon fragiforme TaxID=63214 RepID=UPI0020C6E288|nr:stress responsive A/B barrel domain-containing protein [Hypoxylon fragiforme]KAI2603058.1 stress responsive A/B barrel domain-containing protein [Hypoxylon fragiforme]
MAIYHLVLLKFKDLIPPEEVKSACSKFLSLGDNCLHPTTQKTYFKVVGGGKDNSPENLQNGLTHAFVVYFENGEEDREYYLKTDPVHMEFSVDIKELVEKIQVVDFTPGVF